MGARVHSVDLKRPDMLRNGRATARAAASKRLLAGDRIERLVRHGKQLAIVGSSGSAVCIHLGMTGQLFVLLKRPEQAPSPNHVHCQWRLDRRNGAGTLIFRDPRRFGGMWAYQSLDAMQEDRWSRLGPDALTITTPILSKQLAGMGRAIKSALLDQSKIAGVGNIYADEALFIAGIHPKDVTSKLPRERIRALASALRKVLRRSIDTGGTTLRDYVDGNGRPGWFSVNHAVYGRAGQPCINCGGTLERLIVAQRSTVYCESCQVPRGMNGCGPR